jgi:hypothetical protein
MKTKAAVGAFLLAALGLATSGSAFVFIKDNRTGGGALPIKWPAGTVAIQIKLGSNAAGTLNYDAAVQAASRDWNAVIGNLQITSTIAAPGPAAQSNGVNEIVFADKAFDTAFDSQTLAVTTTWSIGNERTQADIVFNTAFQPWGVYDGARQSNVDLRRVALHELGHLLGLDHPDTATPAQSVSAIMNSRISSLDRISSDDIAGAQQLYGPPGVPANDDFANAINITLNNNTATVTGFNTNASKQTGEPAHVTGNAAARSVWWKWTAPAAGPVTVDTRGSYLDTVLAVYTGTALSNLTTIGNNDDISSTPHIQASTVTFTATGGTTYYFAVDGWDGDMAGITLNVNQTPTSTPVPTISSQPTSVTVTAGGTASFSVTAANVTTNQWSFNNSPVAGATSSTLTISNAQSANAGTYFVTLTNSGGSVASSSVSLTVNPAPVVTPTPTPASSGGGGGGGAPSLWFSGALGLLLLVRRFLRR